MAVEVVVERGTHAMGYCGNVLLIAWRTRLDLRGAEDSGEALSKLVARFPAGVAIYSHVSRGCPIPEAPARNLIARIITEQKALIADSSAFEGGSMREALVRATVAILNALSTKRTPSDVFGNLDDAATWLVEKAAPGRLLPDAPTLVAAMRELVAGPRSVKPLVDADEGRAP